MAKAETAVVLRFHSLEEVSLMTKALNHINENRMSPQELTIRDNILDILVNVRERLIFTAVNKAKD